MLGRLFHRVGRVPMISGCYLMTSGAILALTGFFFQQDLLNVVSLTLL